MPHLCSPSPELFRQYFRLDTWQSFGCIFVLFTCRGTRAHRSPPYRHRAPYPPPRSAPQPPNPGQAAPRQTPPSSPPPAAHLAAPVRAGAQAGAVPSVAPAPEERERQTWYLWPPYTTVAGAWRGDHSWRAPRPRAAPALPRPATPQPPARCRGASGEVWSLPQVGSGQRRMEPQNRTPGIWGRGVWQVRTSSIPRLAKLLLPRHDDFSDGDPGPEVCHLLHPVSSGSDPGDGDRVRGCVTGDTLPEDGLYQTWSCVTCVTCREQSPPCPWRHG